MAVSATAFLDTQAAAPDWSDSEYPTSVYPYLTCSIDTSACDSRQNLKVSSRNRRLRLRC